MAYSPFSSYEGLPFVPRRRLVAFLANWERCEPGEGGAAAKADNAPAAGAAAEGEQRGPPNVSGGSSARLARAAALERDSVAARQPLLQRPQPPAALGLPESRQAAVASVHVRAGAETAPADPTASSLPDVVDDHGAIRDLYFGEQEEAFHTLLFLASEVSKHTDYWLDWATPVHKRPRWLYNAGRRLQRTHCQIMGYAGCLAAPSETAQHLTEVHRDLCRLTAFIQVTSFETLDLEPRTHTDRGRTISQVRDRLARQVAATRFVAGNLARPFRPRPDGAGRGDSSTAGGQQRRSRRSSLAATASRAAGAVVAATALPPLSPAHFGLAGANGAGVAASVAASLGTAGSAAAAPFAEASVAMLLEESRQSVQVLVANLTSRLRAVGQPTHFSCFGLLYGIMGLGCAPLLWSLLRDKGSRAVVSERALAFGRTFISEWIWVPLQQLVVELFRRTYPLEEALEASRRELKADEAALARMLHSFAAIVRESPDWNAAVFGGAHVGEASDAILAPGDLKLESVEDLAERYFETSLDNPISKLMYGQLGASLMVQCQRMKVLLRQSLHAMDGVVVQLKWDFLMAGVMPAVTVSAIWLWVISQVRRDKLMRRRHEMVRALQSVDRHLNRHSQVLPLGRSSTASKLCRATSSSDLPDGPCSGGAGSASEEVLDILSGAPSAAGVGVAAGVGAHANGSAGSHVAAPSELTLTLESLDKVGAALERLDRLCRLATRAKLQGADWRAFRRDIFDLASPELSVAQKLHTIAAMRSTYAMFRIGDG